MHCRGGKALALIAVLALVAFGATAVAGKKKKHGGQLPRGPYPTLGSCPGFPAASAGPNAPSAGDQSAWNQDISGAPLDPNSANYISYINAHGGNDTHPDWGYQREYGFPYAVVTKKQKRTRVNFTAYGDESDHGAYRVPLKALVEGGQASEGDRHVLTVDRARCKLYELYRAFAKKKPKPHWNADAAGLPIFPGLARFDEAASGQINHALRITVESTQNAWIHPASHCAGDTSDQNAPPMGLRLRLQAGYDISGFNPHAKAIATALKRYGAFIADNGSNFYISGTSDKRWTDSILEPLRDIPGTAFEVVQSASPVHRC